MTDTAKTCTKCHETKPLDEFYTDNRAKSGKVARCKECSKKEGKKYRQEHREDKARYDQEHKDEVRQRLGHLSMYENKSCASYLGVVIGERLCRHLFEDVEVMPNGNPGFDIICNKGMKINVKSACITLTYDKYPHWGFCIDYNKVPDFFILVAFDNRTDLNPLHMWMFPGNILNNNSGAQISPSTIHKWDEWKRDIKDAQLCCTEMKCQYEESI